VITMGEQEPTPSPSHVVEDAKKAATDAATTTGRTIDEGLTVASKGLRSSVAWLVARGEEGVQAGSGVLEGLTVRARGAARALACALALRDPQGDALRANGQPRHRCGAQAQLTKASSFLDEQQDHASQAVKGAPPACLALDPSSKLGTPLLGLRPPFA
jgi:hypothetical protein